MGRNNEWIRSTLAHEETGAVPYNFMFSPRALKAVQGHYGVEDVAEFLDLPMRMSGTKTIKPLYADPEQFGATARDEYGVVWTTNAIDRGSPIGPCLREPDLTGYNFPDPTAMYRYEDLEDWCYKNREHYTIVWVGDLWERATFMRGMENLLLDMMIAPEFVHQLLRGIADHVLQTMYILFARFQFDCIALSDDYGTQKSLLMSPTDWRRFVKPLLAEIYGLAKKHHRRIFHHSCGNNELIIPDLIELGLDILHPIQPETMDILKLKREYGKDLTFCGGLRTQDLLPMGSPEDVRSEVRRLKHEMGQGGGYILEPGITIQADVPIENLVAMIEEARKTD